ncbi:MAG TPA: UdgX family uracil-DNA binding protein [Xanthobacteraceae bacterium]|nr:UdgX family uracil-DNA binding protein [Xanthobacteraceae bacterium]
MDEPGPDLRSLAALARAENACRRCPLFRDATQVVPGEGRPRARMLLVGEQPGDREDLEGRPFVGPAGRILDEALREAEIPREETFVTNAVKHFKHARRGKRRLHKKPNAYEIDRCRWWLDIERALLKPAVVVALGATAARGVAGRPLVVGRARGSAMSLPDGSRLVVTVHPSYLLRIRNSGDWRSEYRRFVADLRVAARCVPAEPGHVSAA